MHAKPSNEKQQSPSNSPATSSIPSAQRVGSGNARKSQAQHNGHENGHERECETSNGPSPLSLSRYDEDECDATTPDATAISTSTTNTHAAQGCYEHRVGRIASAVSTILDCLDVDANCEGLRKTPERYAKVSCVFFSPLFSRRKKKEQQTTYANLFNLLHYFGNWSQALLAITDGYRQTVEEVVGEAHFSENHSEMVLMRDIDIFSTCEHHLLPFHGQCHVSYIPSGCVIGLSKIARIVNMFARRLQVQERLTSQIANAIESATDAQGVMVYISCTHMCMSMRGVQKVGADTCTTAVRGRYADDGQLRAQFLSILSAPRSSR